MWLDSNQATCSFSENLSNLMLRLRVKRRLQRACAPSLGDACEGGFVASLFANDDRP
jgi:hypothetical protein